MPLSEEEIQTLSQNYENARSELANTQKALTDVQTQLTQRDTACQSLEKELTAIKTRVSTLDEDAASKEKELTTANAALHEAVMGYRKLALAANPDVPEELISGDDIASINTSLERARAIVGKVQQNIQSSMKKIAVPAGAPPRGEPDLSALSPREKIMQGITRGK